LRMLLERYERGDGKQPEKDADGKALTAWHRDVLYPIKYRVLIILGDWLERYITDPKTVAPDVESFCETVLSREHAEAVPAIKERLDIGLLRVRSLTMPDRADPATTQLLSSTPLPKKVRTAKDLDLLDVDPLEVARQLTLMDYSLYCAVLPRELVRKAWSEKKHKNTAFYVRAVIESCNRVRP
jgi:hypothetical protein